MKRSSQNREGYIRNPWSKENDGIHITAFFKRLSEDASRRCGCHYEIYEKMCLDNFYDAIATLQQLNKADAAYVREQAQYHGYQLSAEEQQRTEKAYREVMADIQREQI